MNKIFVVFALSLSILSASPMAYADTPKFSDYKVTLYQGKKAESISKQDLEDDGFFRGRQENLKEALTQGVNFSGHYAIAFYGCGGECLAAEVVDVKTGKVYYDNEWLSGILNIHSGHLKKYPKKAYQGGEQWRDKEIHFKKNSSLLVLKGAWGEDDNAKVGTFYLNFKNGKFHLLKENKKPPYTVILKD